MDDGVEIELKPQAFDEGLDLRQLMPVAGHRLGLDLHREPPVEQSSDPFLEAFETARFGVWRYS